MTPADARKTILLIGLFVVMIYLAHGTFVLLTPLPEHPEILRAKASIMLQEAESRLKLAWLKQTVYIGASILISGTLIVFCSLWVAGVYLRRHHQDQQGNMPHATIIDCSGE